MSGTQTPGNWRRGDAVAETFLRDPQQALHHYLDALLAEIPPLAEEATRDATTRPAPAAETAMETPAAPRAEEHVPFEAAFKLLSFQVHGLTLAVPLAHLDGVVVVRRLHHFPHAPAWCRGVMVHRGRRVRVVDTAAVLGLTPGTGDPPPAGAGARGLLVGGHRYALSCDALSSVIEVDPQAVRWRRRRSHRRPWYWGVIKSRLWVLLDAAGLVRHLAGGQDVRPEGVQDMA